MPILLLAGGIAVGSDEAQAVRPPTKALSSMIVADGLDVSLVASEPLIRQPVTLTFDARGRLWLIQYCQYPNPAGRTPVAVDQYLRTRYDRVPDPPPKGPVGLDKVTILEDANHDGQADRAIDFIAGLNLATGLCLAGDGVYVMQPPYLLFYPDHNHDDRPDRDPDVLLSGFGTEDSHAYANSLQWGPDGWLYGAQGSTVTANVRGIEFQQGIWRYHPVTKEFELFSEGGGNTWGLDFDAAGQIVAGTNWGGHAMLHQLQGAYYVKGFAKHGELHNPHAYGYFDHVLYMGFRGGHVTCGGIVYQGNTFPSRYRGQYIAGNLLSNAIHSHALEPRGSTYKSKFAGEVMTTDDRWFRPVDCLVGPDGAVYVADWYDKRANHVDPHDDWHKTSGRIYRIQAKGAPRMAPFDLAQLDARERVGLLTHANVWQRREGIRLIRESRDLHLCPEFARTSITSADADAALTALWAFAQVGGDVTSLAPSLLESPYPAVRAWSIRLVGDAKSVPTALAEKWARQAERDKSPIVLAQLACSARRIDGPSALTILRALLNRDDQKNDPFLPLLCWWGIEDRAISHRDQVIALAKESSAIIDGALVERVARRYAAEGRAADWASCATLLSMPGPRRATVVEGMNKALAGRRLDRVPPELVSTLEALNKKDFATLRLSIRLGDRSAYAGALQALADPRTPIARRRALLELFAEIANKDAVETMVSIFQDPSASTLHGSALTALARHLGPSLAQRLLARLTTHDVVLRRQVLDALASKPETASLLIGAVEQGIVKPAEIGDDRLLAIAAFNDADLGKRMEKLYGKIARPSAGERSARIHGLAVSLNMMRGNADRGKAVFTKTCGKCHALFGEGQKLGPDLTVADRRNTRFLLQHIVDPSALIRKEYLSFTAVVDDGRVLTGLVTESSGDSVTLVNAEGQKTVLARSHLESLEPSPVSLMPERLLDQLNVEEVRDLFAYLQGEPPASASVAK